jgi:quercetin dioxygenase-like cupin family protein
MKPEVCGMEMFKIGDYLKSETPTPGKRFSKPILTGEQGAADFRGISAVLPPGSRVDYHFHNRRESLLIGISGEATEIVEGKKYSFKADQIIYMPAGEKHGMVNNSQNDFRYIEFFNGADKEDRINVDWPGGLL